MTPQCATIISAIIAATVSLFTVLLTNFIYWRGKRDERRKETMVRLKTRFIRASLQSIAEKLRNDDTHDNVFVFSGKDGFDFVDKSEHYGGSFAMLLSIKNSSDKNISRVRFNAVSKLRTSTENSNDYESRNFIDLLKDGEEILVKMLGVHETEWLYDMLMRHPFVRLEFSCTITYVTEGKQEVRHVHERKMSFSPICDVGTTAKSFDIVTEKSEDRIDVKNKTSKDDKTEVNTAYRNLQDKIASVRWQYRPTIGVDIGTMPKLDVKIDKEGS